MEASRSERPAGRTPGYDGIRAIAIAAVIALHSGLRIAKGGTAGVDLFFVLSGFLITSLIVAEHERSGRVRFGAFYSRRFARLMPALLMMVVVVLLLSQILNEPTLPRHPTALGALLSVTYTSNIAIAFFNTHVGPFFHTWTLGMEEYYYLIWPPSLVLALRRGATRLQIARWTALAIALIAVYRILVWMVFNSQSHARYGFDTRSDTLLFGSALGLAAPYLIGRITSKPGSQQRLTRLGWLSVAVFFLMVVAAPPLTFLVIAGYWLTAAAAGTMILCVAAAPGFSVTSLLSWGLIAYIGRISYSLYLWDAPLADTFPNRIGPLPHSVTVALQYATILAAAIISHHAIEIPIQRMVRRRQRTLDVGPPAIDRDPTPVGVSSATSQA